MGKYRRSTKWHWEPLAMPGNVAVPAQARCGTVCQHEDGYLRAVSDSGRVTCRKCAHEWLMRMQLLGVI